MTKRAKSFQRFSDTMFNIAAIPELCDESRARGDGGGDTVDVGRYRVENVARVEMSKRRLESILNFAASPV